MTPVQDQPHAAPVIPAGRPRRPHPANITVQVGDGVITVTVTGRVDQLAAIAFREDLAEIWPACAGLLAVDLSGCTYLSPSAISALQDVWRRPPPHGQGQLRITATHPDVTAALDNAHIPRIREPVAPDDGVVSLTGP